MKQITTTTITATPAHEELALNLTLGESLLRGMTAILLPMFLVLIDRRLLVFSLPVIVYLYITAMTHICPVKRAWTRLIEKRRDADTNQFWDRG